MRSSFTAYNLNVCRAALYGQRYVDTRTITPRWACWTVRSGADVGREGPWQQPRLKSLSSSVRPILLQMFVYHDFMAVCAWLYAPVSDGCGWNTWVQQSKGVSTHFCCVVYRLQTNACLGQHLDMVIYFIYWFYTVCHCSFQFIFIGFKIHPQLITHVSHTGNLSLS